MLYVWASFSSQINFYCIFHLLPSATIKIFVFFSKFYQFLLNFFFVFRWSFLIEEKSIWRISISRRALFSGAIIETKSVCRAFPSFRLSTGSPLVIAFSELGADSYSSMVRRGVPSRPAPFSNPLQVTRRLACEGKPIWKPFIRESEPGCRIELAGGSGGGGFYWFWHTLPLSKTLRPHKCAIRSESLSPNREFPTESSDAIEISLSFPRRITRVIECTRPASPVRVPLD